MSEKKKKLLAKVIIYLKLKMWEWKDRICLAHVASDHPSFAFSHFLTMASKKWHEVVPFSNSVLFLPFLLISLWLFIIYYLLLIIQWLINSRLTYNVTCSFFFFFFFLMFFNSVWRIVRFELWIALYNTNILCALFGHKDLVFV